jgi:hypothetical protein
MSKALWGTHATPSSVRLLDEVRALRERVAELEAALAAAEAVRDARPTGAPDAVAEPREVDDLVVASDREPATT